MRNRWLVATGILGFLAITIGAFGAHALPNVLGTLPPEEIEARIEYLDTGSRYHLAHVAALLALAGWPQSPGSRDVRRAQVMFVLGILLFSGSLYAMALTGWRPLGMITPLGGLAMLAGWVCVGRLGWTPRTPE